VDFSLNEIQQELVKTVGEFGRKQSPVERARKMRDDELGWSRELWRQMGELGWIMAPFPEDVGGLGGSFVDAALILEQFGHTLIPEPYGPTVVAGMAILASGDDAQKARYLTPALGGEESLALAWSEGQSRYDITAPSTAAMAVVDGGYTLSGEKLWVLNGQGADHMVVTAATSDGPGLFLIAGDADGLTKRTVQTMEGQRAAQLKLDGVPAERLGEGDQSDVLHKLLDFGAAAAVAEGLGIAQTVLTMTLEYLNTREQFGTKIGSFQALQHRAVDMFVEVELLRSINMASMVKVDDPDPIERQRWVSAAKHQLTQSGRYVVQDGVQLHGGIGVTDEHDIGLYFKRMHVLNAIYGDATFHTARFATLDVA